MTHPIHPTIASRRSLADNTNSAIINCSAQMLRFFKMGYRLFGLFTLLGLGVLAPVNYSARPPVLNGTSIFQWEDSILPAISVDNVPNQSQYLRVHMAFTWIFSLLIIAYVVSFYRGYVLLKLQYDEHALRQTKMRKIEMRSVMVFGVPRELRDEVDLASYFEGLGLGHVENAVLCRNWSLLRNAIQKRAYFLSKLEQVSAYITRQRDARRRRSIFSWCFLNSWTSCRTQSLPQQVDRTDMMQRIYEIAEAEEEAMLERNTSFAQNSALDANVLEVLSRIDLVDPRFRPQHRIGLFGLSGPLVDSASYYAVKFHQWDRQVAQLRRVPERSAATAVGIVTFESPVSATVVSQTVVQRRPFACMIKMAPEPRDIYWPNLSSKAASSYTKVIRSLLVFVSLFMLIFFSTFVVSSIAGFIDLRRLAVYFPALGSILKDLPDTWTQFIQGVIPASLLTLWTSSLPTVLLYLSQAQGLEATSWIEISLLSKYFFYQLWNILFVTVFASTFVYDILPNPQKVIELLGQMMPKIRKLIMRCYDACVFCFCRATNV
eukprot:jgi/Hompol1/4746/HPOL_000503-RA